MKRGKMKAAALQQQQCSGRPMVLPADQYVASARVNWRRDFQVSDLTDLMHVPPRLLIRLLPHIRHPAALATVCLGDVGMLDVLRSATDEGQALRERLTGMVLSDLGSDEKRLVLQSMKPPLLSGVSRQTSERLSAGEEPVLLVAARDMCRPVEDLFRVLKDNRAAARLSLHDANAVALAVGAVRADAGEYHTHYHCKVLPAKVPRVPLPGTDAAVVTAAVLRASAAFKDLEVFQPDGFDFEEMGFEVLGRRAAAWESVGFCRMVRRAAHLLEAVVAHKFVSRSRPIMSGSPVRRAGDSLTLLSTHEMSLAEMVSQQGRDCALLDGAADTVVKVLPHILRVAARAEYRPPQTFISQVCVALAATVKASASVATVTVLLRVSAGDLPTEIVLPTGVQRISFPALRICAVMQESSTRICVDMLRPTWFNVTHHRSAEDYGWDDDYGMAKEPVRYPDPDPERRQDAWLEVGSWCGRWSAGTAVEAMRMFSAALPFMALLDANPMEVLRALPSDSEVDASMWREAQARDGSGTAPEKKGNNKKTRKEELATSRPAVVAAAAATAAPLHVVSRTFLDGCVRVQKFIESDGALLYTSALDALLQPGAGCLQPALLLSELVLLQEVVDCASSSATQQLCLSPSLLVPCPLVRLLCIADWVGHEGALQHCLSLLSVVVADIQGLDMEVLWRDAA